MLNGVEAVELLIIISLFTHLNINIKWVYIVGSQLKSTQLIHHKQRSLAARAIKDVQTPVLCGLDPTHLQGISENRPKLGMHIQEVDVS